MMVFDLGVDTMVLRWVVKKGDVNGSRRAGANRTGIPNFAVDSAVASVNSTLAAVAFRMGRAGAISFPALGLPQD
jgi:hypothetical protein